MMMKIHIYNNLLNPHMITRDIISELLLSLAKNHPYWLKIFSPLKAKTFIPTIKQHPRIYEIQSLIKNISL